MFLTGEEPEEHDFDMPKVYEPIESFESLKDRLNMFLSMFNESIRGAGMDMVFFTDAMIHLVKVPFLFCMYLYVISDNISLIMQYRKKYR